MALIKTTSDKFIFKCWIITSFIYFLSTQTYAQDPAPFPNTLAMQTQAILRKGKKGLLPLSQNATQKQVTKETVPEAKTKTTQPVIAQQDLITRTPASSQVMPNVVGQAKLGQSAVFGNELLPQGQLGKAIPQDLSSIASQNMGEVKVPIAVVEDPNIIRINHSVWENILQHYVNKEGAVNYRALKRDNHDMESLNAYIADLSMIDPSSLNHPTEVKAAWLNLYNAIALKQIVEAYPVSNVLKIKDFFTRVYLIGSKKYSLVDIEQVVFAGELHDRRTVFARSYGAKGAPKLNTAAYSGAKIDEQLNDAMLRFVKQNGNVLWDADKGKLILSGFFMFYQQEIGDVVGLMRSFAPEMPAKTPVIYGAFDWALNDAS